MKILVWIHLLLIFSSVCLLSQNYYPSVAAACGASSFQDISVLNNPAKMREIENSFASFVYAPSKFEMKELSSAGAAFSKRFISSSVVGVSVFNMGGNLFREYTGAFHFCQEIDSSLALGVSANYASIHVKSYASDYKIAVDIAGIVDLNEYLTAGFVLNNVNGDYFEGGDKNVERKAQFGFGVMPLESFAIDLDAVVNVNQSSGFCFAASYNVEDIVFIRAAYQTSPKLAEAGAFIVPTSFFSISCNLNYHFVLGYSARLSSSFVFSI